MNANNRHRPQKTGDAHAPARLVGFNQDVYLAELIGKKDSGRQFKKVFSLLLFGEQVFSS